MKAESNRALGYNGQSARSKRRHARDAREKEIEDERVRNSSVGMFFDHERCTHLSDSKTTAAFMAFFAKPSKEGSSSTLHAPIENALIDSPPIFMGYLSDLSDDDPTPEDNNVDDEEDHPPVKRQRKKLDIPARMACLHARAAREKQLREGLKAIEKLIALKRTVFAAG